MLSPLDSKDVVSLGQDSWPALDRSHLSKRWSTGKYRGKEPFTGGVRRKRGARTMGLGCPFVKSMHAKKKKDGVLSCASGISKAKD